MNHPLVKTLFTLKGNPKACVLTEPVFGIPYNLFVPYASVYMLALGLKDQQIGLIASLSLVLQIFTALLGGAITDKYGRRLTLLVTDFLSWSVPCLIWAISQDFRYFLLAGLFNSLWRISHTAWSCLLVEDADQSQMVHIWTWIYIFAYGSAFVAPLAGVMINKLDLVPAMRIIYGAAFVLLTLKLSLTYIFSHETKRGIERMAETRNQSLFSQLREYRSVFGQLLHSRGTLVSMALLLMMSIFNTVNSSFWAVLVTAKMHIPSENIAIFPFVRSLVLLACLFWLTPRLNTLRFRRPLALGFAGFLASQALLVIMPEQNYFLLGVSVILEAFSAAMVSPLLDSLLAVTMNAAERARLISIVYVAIILFTSPFGWIAGQLSAINRTFPFILNMALFVIAGGLVVASKWLESRPGADTAAPAAS